MARTKEQVDHLNQFRDDASKLPYENEGDAPNEPTAEAKQAAIDAKVKEDEAAALLLKEKETIVDETKDKDKEKEITPAAKVELTDEEKRQIAMQVLGVTDLSELIKKSEIKKEPTKEELQAAADKREADKVAYALQQGLVSKKQYEDFITDAKDPKELVFAQYYAEQLAEDDKLSEESIRAEFEEKFGLDTQEDSRMYKRGMKEINLLAENIIKTKYAAIYELNGKYDAYETGENNKVATQQKILSQAPAYKKDVEDTYGELKKVNIQISKDEAFEAEISEEILNKYKEQMLDADYSTKQILSGYSKEILKDVLKTAAIIEDLPNILKKYGDAQVLRYQAGTRGIPPTKAGGGKVPVGELTADQKKALNFAFGENQQPIAN